MDNVLVLKDYKTTPDIVHEYGPTLKFGHIPLVIDNGKHGSKAQSFSTFIIIKHWSECHLMGLL